MIRIEDLEKIINIVENHDISHFEFEQDSSRVVIEKNQCSSLKYKSSIENSANNAEHDDSTYKVKDSCTECSEDTGEKSDNSSGKYIKSSLAGTFYLKKDESSAPFVKIGDEVNENTIVGLVEVMKLFDEIEAGLSGKISKILVKDGEFVEYGQPLFELS